MFFFILSFIYLSSRNSSVRSGTCRHFVICQCSSDINKAYFCSLLTTTLQSLSYTDLTKPEFFLPLRTFFVCFFFTVYVYVSMCLCSLYNNVVLYGVVHYVRQNKIIKLMCFFVYVLCVCWARNEYVVCRLCMGYVLCCICVRIRYACSCGDRCCHWFGFICFWLFYFYCNYYYFDLSTSICNKMACVCVCVRVILFVSFDCAFVGYVSLTSPIIRLGMPSDCVSSKWCGYDRKAFNSPKNQRKQKIIGWLIDRRKTNRKPCYYQ